MLHKEEKGKGSSLYCYRNRSLLLHNNQAMKQKPREFKEETQTKVTWLPQVLVISALKRGRKVTGADYSKSRKQLTGLGEPSPQHAEGLQSLDTAVAQDTKRKYFCFRFEVSAR